jgi:hypothetical protein
MRRRERENGGKGEGEKGSRGENEKGGKGEGGNEKRDWRY